MATELIQGIEELGFPTCMTMISRILTLHVMSAMPELIHEDEEQGIQ